MTDLELVLARVKEIKALGYGQVVVKVHDGKVAQIDTTKAERPTYPP